MLIETALDECGLVAILRGVTPDKIIGVGDALYEAGFRVIEIPMNSPEPLLSIEKLAKHLPQAVVGAGTVLNALDVTRIKNAGGRVIVMPHGDVEVIAEAKRHGLFCIPGIATPTEAFAAFHAGADALKIFAAEHITPAVVKAWRAVLPKDLALLPVGGVTPENMAPYIAAGARGFGIGSALYAPGRSAAETGERARKFAQAWAKAKEQAA